MISAFFTYFWQKKKEIQLEENTRKTKHYLCILVLMYTHYINSPKELESLKLRRPDIENMDDVKRELQMEWVNLWMFADDNTLIKFKNFIETPSETNFAETVLSMRKDLWSKTTKLPTSEFSIKSFSKTKTL